MKIRDAHPWDTRLSALCQQFAPGEDASNAPESLSHQAILTDGFQILLAQGHRLDSIDRFRGTHLAALLQEWSRQGVSEERFLASLRVFRDFAGWIGKAGLVEEVVKRIGVPYSVGPPLPLDSPPSNRNRPPPSETRPRDQRESSSSSVDLHRELAQLLRKHNGAKINGTVASFATQKKRAETLHQGFRQLRALGYKLPNVGGFREKHLLALARHWESQGASASTIQNGISIFRVFADWIGKTGMIRSVEAYVSPGAGSRSSINRVDKSWTAQAVDVNAKLAEVIAKDVRVGLQLKLQAVFGLRAREAVQLRPHLADLGSALALTAGTKGGRERVVPIDTAEKRALVDLAKTFAGSPNASTADPALKLDQALNHYYYVLRSCGISRKDGIVSHGLRHGYANDRYLQIAGTGSPVRGGKVLDRETDRSARLVVAEELGHSRESVTTHYLGR